MARQIAVVTGANRGIGREVVRQLAERDYLVVLGSRDPSKGEQAAHELDPAGTQVIPRKLDITDPADSDALASWLDEVHGHLDVLVNNAAILYDDWSYATRADLDSVHQALETNLFGAWRVTLALLPLLRRSQHARVVNVSSQGGSLSEMTGGAPAYRVSKAALNALTRLLAGELRSHRILVNAVCPGWTDTNMGRGGRPIPDGAASVVWACTLPPDGPTGGFFRDARPLPW